ncbi:hypothetical protein ACF0H5_021910 [Mactra antiquata]
MEDFPASFSSDWYIWKYSDDNRAFKTCVQGLNETRSTMKVATMSLLSIVCLIGVILGVQANYGGGYNYMPVPYGYGGGYGGNSGGFGNGGFLALIGFLFIILLLFGGGFNTTSTPDIVIVDG